VEGLVREPLRKRAAIWFDGVRRSIIRIGWPRTDKDRAAAMISSLFLHIHPARVSRHTLEPTYTFALGLISGILFVVLSVTGLALMLYYVPYPAEAYRRRGRSSDASHIPSISPAPKRAGRCPGGRTLNERSSSAVGRHPVRPLDAAGRRPPGRVPSPARRHASSASLIR
jgi:hypothetical protein